MSAGVQRGQATTRLGRLWQDWRFHLNALVVIAPIVAFPAFYHLAYMGTGEAGLGARPPVTVQVGPFAMQLAEFDRNPPLDAGVAGMRKLFRVAACAGCDARIRSVQVRIGKPRSLRAAGAMFSGPPGRMTADLAIPDSARAQDGLWLTIEEWNGTVHKGEIALAQASPATETWLSDKEKRR